MGTRWFYPYCGYELGFCLKGSPCNLPYGNQKDCPYLRELHPISKDRPYELYGTLEWLEIEEMLEEEKTIDID